MAEFLRQHLSERMGTDEYAEIIGNNGITVFSIYEGVLPTSEIIIGFDENAIKRLDEKGFDICLVVKLQDNKNTAYLDTIERLVKTYNVKHLSIRKSVNSPEKESDGKEHYERLANIINDNNLTLVLTETTSQLSNEKYFGFNDIFIKNCNKVVRSYETYDVSHVDSTKYMFRYQQYLNSTIDRNIRFITVSQIHLSNTSYEKLSDYTILAAKEYIHKVQELGYSVNSNTTEFNYTVNRTPISAVAAAVMVLLCYLMLCIVFDVEKKMLFCAFSALAVFAFGITFVMPSSLVALYPSLWAVISPCFGITVILEFLKKSDRLHTVFCAVITPVIAAVVMSIAGFVQSCLLSGIDYYVNNEIFRGIKLSLFLPLIYAVVTYYFMFIKSEKSLVVRAMNIAVSEIKVYWIFIAAVLGFVALTYLRRSGNVNTISALETTMRNFITDTFAARPRTKEFLIGYPCLVLLVFYLKKTNLSLIGMALAAGGAIVTASISNSFCHVFTDAATIYMRVVNGILIGSVVCIVAYIGNLIFYTLCVKAIAYFKSKYFSERI